MFGNWRDASQLVVNVIFASAQSILSFNPFKYMKIHPLEQIIASAFDFLVLELPSLPKHLTILIIATTFV